MGSQSQTRLNDFQFHFSLSKFWNFNNRPSNEYSGLISFWIDWFDLLAVQGIIWDNEEVFEMESGEDCTTL